MKRYGVFTKPGEPQFYALKREFERWEDAEDERRALQCSNPELSHWRIWDYSCDPPRDVTDENPEEDTEETLVIIINADNAHAALNPSTRSLYGDMVEQAISSRQPHYSHTYRVTVERIDPPEEQQKWWFYQRGEWSNATTHEPGLMVDAETGETLWAIFKAKEGDREQVMENLRQITEEYKKALAKAGGKP